MPPRINMNKILKDYYSARNKHEIELKKLEFEVSRIIPAIGCALGFQYTWWAFKYYSAGEALPLPDIILDTAKDFPIYLNCNLDSDRTSYDYTRQFPIIFFDMSNSKIVEYVKKELLEHRLMLAKKKQEKKSKYKLNREAKIAAAKSAIAKLTSEEIKLLGLKLHKLINKTY